MAVDRKSVRVLVVDDHSMFRMGLSMGLRALGFRTIDEAVDGRHAVELSTGRRYDVVFLDLKMPRMNGIDAARAILATAAATRPVLIMLTTFDEPAVIHAAVDAGVAAFFSKATEPEVLARCVDDLLAGRSTRIVPEHQVPTLTPREAEVIRLLCSGLATKEIAAELGIAPETAKDYIGRVYAKLGVNDRVSAANAARWLGWVVLDEIRVTGQTDQDA